jgi:hypothetical protein
MSLGHTQSDPLLSYVFNLTFQTFYAGYGGPISCTSTMANQLCLLRPPHWFAPVPACLPQHALFPSTERTPLARSSLVAASTGGTDKETIRMQCTNVYGKSVCVCVCVCLYMGAVTTIKVWYNVSRKNSHSFVAILTCVNAKYIFSICF